MKKNLLLSVIMISAFVFLYACGDDKATEVEWKNLSGGAAVNEIVWADGDANWTQSGGYADQATTEAKEVSKLTGTVSCLIYDSASSTFTAPDSVQIGAGDSSATLAEGELNSLQLYAAAKKK